MTTPSIRAALERLVKAVDHGDTQALADAMAAAHAALAAEPEPPADGEVAEMVAWLRLTADGEPCERQTGIYRLARAADLLSRLAEPEPPVDGEVANWKIVLSEDGCAPDAREYFDRDFSRLTGGMDIGSFKMLALFRESDCGMTQSWMLGDIELSISAYDPFYAVRKRVLAEQLASEPYTLEPPADGEVTEPVLPAHGELSLDEVTIGAARVENTIPAGYRLVTKGDGNGNTIPVLQGYFTWTQGWNRYGGEWRDLETQEWLYAKDDVPFGQMFQNNFKGSVE